MEVALGDDVDVEVVVEVEVVAVVEVEVVELQPDSNEIQIARGATI